LVEDLVSQRKVKLLSLLFCPVDGLAWEIQESDITDEQLLNMRDVSRNAGKHNIANMIEFFVKFRWFRTLSDRALWNDPITWANEETRVIDQVLFLLESGPPIGRSNSALATASTMLNFCAFWGDFHPTFDSGDWGLSSLAENGSIKSLRIYVGADPSVLRRFGGPFVRSERSVVDEGEYHQPELNRTTSEHYVATKPTKLSLVEIAALGRCERVRPWGQMQYLSALESFFEAESECTLVEFLTAGSGFKKTGLVESRIRLLSDDACLEGSQAVVDFLVHEQGMHPPNAFDLIRWRRCGMLRWLVDRQMIDLHCSPISYPHAAQEIETLQVLCEQPIPDTMTLGLLFCFCAIEFDDLQSLLWLVQDQGIQIETAMVHGWNVAHACAFFGRSEIAVSLYKLGWLNSENVTAECRRAPHQEAFAAHMAVDRVPFNRQARSRHHALC